MGKVFKKYQVLCIYLLLALVTIAVFWQVRNFELINYDDWDYVRDNEHVNTGLNWENVIWAFTESHASNWHPLTWISHMLDCQLFGLAPGGHHLTNLFLHVVNTLLLFAVLSRMTGAVWRSVFVAAAFAIHPLHIESVAWVSERKDVLSTFFWILTMGAYLGYVNRPNKSRYLLTLVVFGLGLMAKPMLVTLPLVLLLLDYWPLGRFEKALHHKNARKDRRKIFGHLLLEKVPLLALSVGSCAITFFAQKKGGSVIAINLVPVGLRIANAIISYAKYIGKMIWPSRLAVFYPHPGDNLSLLGAVLIAILLFIISVWVICLAKKRGYLAVGWFWYIITLLPVIGIVQVGSQALADRYTYVSLIGIFIIIAWAGAELTAKLPYRKIVLTVLSVTVFSAMAVGSRRQLRHWRDSITIFEHAIEVTGDNVIAHSCLIKPLYEQGKIKEALVHGYEAFRINPNDYQVHSDLAVLLAREGKLEQAIKHYKEMIRLSPDNADVYNDLGIALDRQGKLDLAVDYFNKALQIDPEFAKAHFNLGYALKRQGKFEQAVEHYTRAIQMAPDVPVIYKNLADVRIQQGKIAEAIEQYQHVLRLTPDNVQVHNDLGLAFAQQGKLDQAAGHFNKALQINPEFAQAQYNLGYALGRHGKLNEAVIALKKTIELDPNYILVYQMLGQILSQQGRMNEAVENFKQGLRVQPDRVEMMNALAWMLSVHKSADYHDPNQAISLAKRASELTGYEAPAVLDTLACAYAASGKFSEAIATAEKALELARSKEQDQQLIDSIQNNLDLFQAGKAYYKEE